MKRPDTIMIEGRAYRWRAILELRRKQLEEWHAAQPMQAALFDFKDDRRPVPERTPPDATGSRPCWRGYKRRAVDAAPQGRVGQGMSPYCGSETHRFRGRARPIGAQRGNRSC